jgi:hypothetical protein
VTIDEGRDASTVRTLWELFEARAWDRALSLLHPEFEAYWPHTGERIRGPDNFIRLNSAYPEGWSISIKRVIPANDVVVSEIEVSHVDLGTSYAASFFEMRDGLIHRATEYWVDDRHQDAPAWRSAWVELD